MCVTANAGIGNVSESLGAPGEITRGKAILLGSTGTGIETNDIYTTKTGIVHITFNDNTKVKITENSRLLIDDFVFDPTKSDAGRLALKVGMGTVRYASGQIAKTNNQQVSIKTPTATIAVRGTDFTMTVDEAGQSLIVLIPSCKDEEKIKDYELEENKCKVGKIEVTTIAGTVILDQAFHGTFVANSTSLPTSPIVINTVEAKLTNNLIIVRPIEIIRAINNQTIQKKKEEEREYEEFTQSRKLNAAIKKESEETQAAILDINTGYTNRNCNPAISICIIWEKNDSDVANRGRAVAYRNTETEHYAEVKTQGYSSNSSITIIHNDVMTTEILGDGTLGGNVIYIKQNTGLKKK